jgi:3-deoxy-D-manno-octulosonic-acid transferase
VKTSLYRHLYDALYAATVFPSVLFRYLREWKQSGGGRALLNQLQGLVPDRTSTDAVVWLHALNIGEVLLLRPLLESLSEQSPNIRLVLSTRTRSGLLVARYRLPRVQSFLAPLDFSWSVRAAYARLRPKCLVIVELELWPNLVWEARQREVPVLVINTRVNRGDLARLRRWRRILQHPLQSICWWGVQAEADGKQVREVFDLPNTRFAVTGSMKFDSARTPPRTTAVENLKRKLGLMDQHRIFVAGSLHPPEEEIIVEAFKSVRADHPDLRLIIVPHYLSSVRRIERVLTDNDLSYVTFPSGQTAAASVPVIVVDSIGELETIWALAHFGFVGGSFARRGGQNMLEAAARGVPVCCGPNTWNFEDIFSGLVAGGAAVRLQAPADLQFLLRHWIAHPAAARAMGELAAEFTRDKCGATSVTARAIVEVLNDQPT